MHVIRVTQFILFESLKLQVKGQNNAKRCVFHPVQIKYIDSHKNYCFGHAWPPAVLGGLVELGMLLEGGIRHRLSLQLLDARQLDTFGGRVALDLVDSFAEQMGWGNHPGPLWHGLELANVGLQRWLLVHQELEELCSQVRTSSGLIAIDIVPNLQTRPGLEGDNAHVKLNVAGRVRDQCLLGLDLSGGRHGRELGCLCLLDEGRPHLRRDPRDNVIRKAGQSLQNGLDALQIKQSILLLLDRPRRKAELLQGQRLGAGLDDPETGGDIIGPRVVKRLELFVVAVLCAEDLLEEGALAVGDVDCAERGGLELQDVDPILGMNIHATICVLVAVT